MRKKSFVPVKGLLLVMMLLTFGMANAQSPAEKFVGYLNRVGDKMESASSQYEAMRIVESIGDPQIDLTMDDITGYQLTAGDKEQLKNAFTRIFKGMASAVGTSDARAGANTMITMSNSAIDRSSTLHEMMRKLGLSMSPRKSF